jgi:hypothetical protein
MNSLTEEQVIEEWLTTTTKSMFADKINVWTYRTPTKVKNIIKDAMTMVYQKN